MTIPQSQPASAPEPLEPIVDLEYGGATWRVRTQTPASLTALKAGLLRRFGRGTIRPADLYLSLWERVVAGWTGDGASVFGRPILYTPGAPREVFDLAPATLKQRVMCTAFGVAVGERPPAWVDQALLGGAA